MTEQQIDAFLRDTHESIKRVSGLGLDEFVSIARQLAIFGERVTRKVQNVNQLREFLLLCDDSDRLSRLAPQIVRALPTLLNVILAELASEAKAELPSVPTGRKKSLTLQQQAEMCRAIGQWELNGVTRGDARRRAAAKWRVSKGTVERVWSKRKTIFEGAAEASLEELKNVFLCGVLDLVSGIKSGDLIHVHNPAEVNPLTSVSH